MAYGEQPQQSNVFQCYNNMDAHVNRERCVRVNKNTRTHSHHMRFDVEQCKTIVS